MTAEEVIRELEALPPADQAVVIRYAYRLDAERRLTGPELSNLAEGMTRTEDPGEALLVREEILRGFYGGKPHAWDPPGNSPGGTPSPPARPDSAAKHFSRSARFAR